MQPLRDSPAPLLEFRPPLALRVLLAAAGLLTGIAALLLIWRSLFNKNYEELLAAGLLLVPTAIALSVMRRAYILSDTTLEAVSLSGSYSVPLTALRCLDQRLGSLRILSSGKPMAVTFLSPTDRDKLMRALVERARLTRLAEEPPYGIVARYVPRAKDITFVPHHSRRRPDSGESEGVVSSE